DQIQGDRASRYVSAFNLISNYPQGIGWGTAAAPNHNYKGLEVEIGFTSLLLEIFVAFGLFGAPIILAITGFVAVLFLSTSQKSTYVFFALIWSLTHYLFVSNYWFPWPWVLLAFAIVSPKKA